jgi:hypothetical protein
VIRAGYTTVGVSLFVIGTMIAQHFSTIANALALSNHNDDVLTGLKWLLDG